MSAKTYRLPERFGGEEVRIVEGIGANVAGVLVEMVQPPHVRIALSRDKLTEVTPPPPPEPGFAAVVLDRFHRAWQHAACGRGDWCCTMDDLGADWEELNREHGPLTRLIPERVVEPVTLPWFSSDKGKADVTVDTSNSWQARVYVHASHSHLLPNQARAMAGALNTAADAVERAS